MPLSSSDAKELFNLGFKRSAYEDEVYPQDVYEFNKATWVIGGRILHHPNYCVIRKYMRMGYGSLL